MTAWWVVIAVGVGTYALRVAMFAVVGTRQLPAWTQRPLSLVGPAAIGALVGGMLLTEHGHVEIADAADLIAVAAAFVTVRRTGNIARGLLVGLVIAWCLPVVGL